MRRVFISIAIAVASAWQVSAGAAPHGDRAVRQGTTPATKMAGDTALMPAEEGSPGWKRFENVRVFTRADLYGYIDGGAELFLEMGFEQLTLQKYRGGSSEFAVEIYRMSDAAAATGIYLMKCGKETRDASFKARHTINRHQLMFVRERYYVTVNNLSGADRMGPDLLKFGTLVAKAVPADRLPPELKLLPAAGLVAGSERLIRGPYSLQSLFTLGDGDILQLGGKVVGAAGNYADAGGTIGLILIDYPDASAAKLAFGNVRQNLDKYLKPVATTPTKLVFRDYENKFGVVTLTARQLELRLHLPKAPQ